MSFFFPTASSSGSGQTRRTGTGNTRFFENPQGAAVLKHGILGAHLPVFVSKAGKRAKGHRVYFLDGYAGQGTYESGAPGSPALAVETAALLSKTRDLRLLFCEKDQATYDKLCGLLDPGPANWEAFKGPIEDNLDHVLDLAQGSPLFAFFDPFGLMIPFAELTKKVFGRGSRWGAATEVLLNFSLPGLWRPGGKLLPSVNEALGGDWWQPIWKSEHPDRDRFIAEGYRARVSTAAGGWPSTIVPVSDTWLGEPAYYLMFFSKHPDGMWKFHDALSHGIEALHSFCFHTDGVPRMFTFEEENRADWTAKIKGNLEALLEGRKSFNVGEKITAIYGEWRNVRGLARTMHVRAALMELYEEERILTSPTGVNDLNRFYVLPA